MSTEDLRTIGEALTFWREAAESMERQRNEAFQQVAAAELLAAALRSDVQDLTAERDALLRERERDRKRVDLWLAIVKSAHSGLGDLMRGLARHSAILAAGEAGGE